MRLFNTPGKPIVIPARISVMGRSPVTALRTPISNERESESGPGAPANAPEHHYTFELFALDTKLDLGPDASRDDVMKAIDGHILSKAVWEGRFHRH